MGLKQQAGVKHKPSVYLQHAAWNSSLADEVDLDDHKLTQSRQVTELAEAKLVAARMSRLLEVLPGGVIVLNGQGKVQQCNAAAITLLGEPLTGEFWSDVIKRAFAPKVDNSQDIALNNGRLVHISTSPLDGEPGQIVLINDVTETRQLQLKVSHLQRLSAMGEMAAKLAHQIRTPLSSALLYLSPLLKDEVNPNLRQNFAKKLHNSISHMERLVKDMLSFSRGDMASTSEVLVAELFESIEQQLSSQTDSAHFQFSFNNEANDAYVYGSKDALLSAVNNLITNAKLASEDGGEITITARIQQDELNAEWVEFSVADQGHGIAVHDQEKILTSFYTTRSAGTGLGLPVVQSIAKAHRGRLTFTSEEGVGSTFNLVLPRYQYEK